MVKPVAGPEKAGYEPDGERGKADRVLKQMREALPEGICLVGVGGISSGQDAARKQQLGADLVQFYTGFVYRGPGLVGQCVEAWT